MSDGSNDGDNGGAIIKEAINLLKSNGVDVVPGSTAIRHGMTSDDPSVEMFRRGLSKEKEPTLPSNPVSQCLDRLENQIRDLSARLGDTYKPPLNPRARLGIATKLGELASAHKVASEAYGAFIEAPSEDSLERLRKNLIGADPKGILFSKFEREDAFPFIRRREGFQFIRGHPSFGTTSSAEAVPGVEDSGMSCEEAPPSGTSETVPGVEDSGLSRGKEAEDLIFRILSKDGRMCVLQSMRVCGLALSKKAKAEFDIVVAVQRWSGEGDERYEWYEAVATFEIKSSFRSIPDTLSTESRLFEIAGANVTLGPGASSRSSSSGAIPNVVLTKDTPNFIVVVGDTPAPPTEVSYPVHATEVLLDIGYELSLAKVNATLEERWSEIQKRSPPSSAMLELLHVKEALDKKVNRANEFIRNGRVFYVQRPALGPQ